MRIIFSGTPEFAVPTLQMLIDSDHEICAVYTQPDRPAGRGRKLKPSPVKMLAEQAGLPVYQPQSLRTSEELQQFQCLSADLMVVVAYGIILPQDVLDSPALGCLNVHASLLPRWRGAAPIQRAVLAGDTITGVTIMQVVKKLDAGDMLHKEICEIKDRDTASDLHDRLAMMGAIGLQKVLVQLESGDVVAEKQDESLVTYAQKLDKRESVLDWSMPAIELDRKVRGLNAWPVAQTLYQGKVLRIWKTGVVDLPATEPPGTVLCDGRKVEVMTGQGRLQLLEVQLPGGKRMDIQAFQNAHDFDGIRLGE